MLSIAPVPPCNLLRQPQLHPTPVATAGDHGLPLERFPGARVGLTGGYGWAKSDGANDADPDVGQIQVNNVRLGTYTITARGLGRVLRRPDLRPAEEEALLGRELVPARAEREEVGAELGSG